MLRRSPSLSKRTCQKMKKNDCSCVCGTGGGEWVWSLFVGVPKAGIFSRLDPWKEVRGGDGSAH